MIRNIISSHDSSRVKQTFHDNSNNEKKKEEEEIAANTKPNNTFSLFLFVSIEADCSIIAGDFFNWCVIQFSAREKLFCVN